MITLGSGRHDSSVTLAFNSGQGCGKKSFVFRNAKTTRNDEEKRRNGEKEKKNKKEMGSTVSGEREIATRTKPRKQGEFGCFPPN